MPGIFSVRKNSKQRKENMNWIMREVFDINLEVVHPDTQILRDCRIYTHDSPISVIENVWKVLGTPSPV
jgi:hypothetical protein